MTRPSPSGTGLARVLAEAALVAVHVTVVVGFDRLYRGTDFLVPLLAFVLSAHLLAIASRVLSVPAPIVAVVGVAGAALTATWVLFPHTTAFGSPTPSTWSAAGDAIRAARSQFPDVVAPVRATDGYQLLSGLVLAGAVWFADWAAFRLRATAEAVAPAAVVFVFASLLGSGAHQGSSTVAFATAVLTFVAAHRAVRAQLDQSWLAGAPVAGPRALLRAGAAVAVLALAVGALAGPRLPGAKADAVVAWRQHAAGGGSRVTVSPMVELRKRLVDQSDTEVFTVHTNRRAYWRLTSLDRFDGNIWSSSGTFSPAGARLPSDVPEVDRAREVIQTIEIQGLSAIWVPAAYEAKGLPQSSEALRWDGDSSTLIVDSSEPSSNGLTYRVTSEEPILATSVLEADPGRDSTAIAERYGALPAAFPAVARTAARTATAGAANRYQQARMLQDWFRTRFHYSLSTGAGHGDDALTEFLRSREGYCEQFAGAYAAMARSLGIPARVAVGFTPGEQDRSDPTEYHVRGRHAHAWPEVWFPTVGWVPFEPTPGRGMPDAEAHTGVPEAQDDARVTQRTFPTITTSNNNVTTTTIGGAGGTTIPRTGPVAVTGAGSGGGPRSRLGAAAIAAAAAGILVVAWLLAVLLAPLWRRRRLRRRGLSDQVLASWNEVLGPIRWATGQRPAPAETYREFARRLGTALGVAGPPLVALADVVTSASWSPGGATPDHESEAAGLAAAIRTDLAAHESPARRLRRRLSWREAFRPPG
ncbi:MAG: hypothetical protein JWM89_3130 [Acidimicrobiales bacterium]|nr:hypothetical protein [Acidimicrobiales bacterium]